MVKQTIIVPQCCITPKCFECCVTPYAMIFRLFSLPNTQKFDYKWTPPIDARTSYILCIYHSILIFAVELDWFFGEHLVLSHLVHLVAPSFVFVLLKDQDPILLLS